MERNRWWVVFGAILIQLSLGAVYIYSVFKTPLQQMFGWDKGMVALPAQVLLAVFAITMIFAGRIQDKIGPKKVATAGGIILGAGIGITYVCPISACIKWFPDKRGFITGLAVAGFGAGGLIFAPIAKSLIESSNVLTTNVA